LDEKHLYAAIRYIERNPVRVGPVHKKLFRKHARIGRPLGSEEFVNKLEKITGKALKPLKPGRKKEISEVPQKHPKRNPSLY